MHKRFFTFIFLVLGLLGCPQNEEETTLATQNNLSQSEVNMIRSGMRTGAAVRGTINESECSIELDASQGVFTATSADDTVYKGEYFYSDNKLYMMISKEGNYKKSEDDRIYLNAQINSDEINDNTSLSLVSIDKDVYIEAKKKFRDEHQVVVPPGLLGTWYSTGFGSSSVTKFASDGWISHVNWVGGVIVYNSGVYARMILCNGNKFVFEFDISNSEVRSNLSKFTNDLGLYIIEYEYSISNDTMTCEGLPGAIDSTWKRGGSTELVSVDKEMSVEELKSFMTKSSPAGEYTIHITDANPDTKAIKRAFDIGNYAVIEVNIDLSQCTELTKIEFSNFTELKSVKLPESVTEIESGAFKYCTKLENVMIPDSVTTIEGEAFNQCYSLEHITIPQSVTKLGQFTHCDNLSRVDYTGTLDDWCSIDFSSSYPFVADYDLYINNEKITDVTVSDNITEIKNGTFAYMQSLTNINLPDSITVIGDYAFYNCYALKSINIPDGVTSIGKNAFSNCSNLSSITMSDNITSISDFTFGSCESLKSINIPNGVTYIGQEVFRFCKELTEITIPSTVTKIESEAFSFCSKLSTVTVLASTPPRLQTKGYNDEYNIFHLSPVNAIYVPAESVDEYKERNHWKDYADIIQAITE